MRRTIFVRPFHHSSGCHLQHRRCVVKPAMRTTPFPLAVPRVSSTRLPLPPIMPSPPIIPPISSSCPTYRSSCCRRPERLRPLSCRSRRESVAQYRRQFRATQLESSSRGLVAPAVTLVAQLSQVPLELRDPLSFAGFSRCFVELPWPPCMPRIMKIIISGHMRTSNAMGAAPTSQSIVFSFSGRILIVPRVLCRPAEAGVQGHL